MAVALSDLVPSLLREVQTPGTNTYPNATIEDWQGYLADAFWEVSLLGIICPTRFTESGFEISSVSPTGSDLGRDYQQLLVLWAGARVVSNKILEYNSAFRAHAGPVEFEQRKAASVLTAVLERIQKRLDDIMAHLPNKVKTNTVHYFDVISERTANRAPADFYDRFVGY
jgi:hypothetical protein